MWETQGLMTRIDKAIITTICNRGPCSTISITEVRFDKAKAPLFLNGDVAQMVERSLSMREVRGLMPRISNFWEGPGNQKRKYGKLLCYTKRRHGFVRPIWERKHLKSTELAEKAISAPNRQGLPQKDVEGNINSTDGTIKDIRLTYTAHVDPTSEACQSGGQTIGMWETHGLMTRTDKANITTICNRGLCSTISITEGRFHKEIAPRFLNGDVAQMVERSLWMREVRGSMPPHLQIFRGARKSKRKYGKLFC